MKLFFPELLSGWCGPLFDPQLHCTVQENFAPALDQLRKIILDEENWIPLERPRLACEAGRAIDDEQLRFTARTGEQKDFTRLWMAGGAFRFEYRSTRPVYAQRQPYGLSAPASMNNLSAQRQHLHQALARLRRQIPSEASNKEASSNRKVKRRHSLTLTGCLGPFIGVPAGRVLDGFKAGDRGTPEVPLT